MQQENKTISISVLDAPMGTGKTTAITTWMNNNPNKKYLYVSPMLTEVEERIPTACAGLGFEYPTMKYNSDTGVSSKGYSLLCYLREGKNVAFTHALFKEMTPEHTKLIKEEGYTLIIDEEIPFIDPYDGYYKRDDIVSLESKGFIYVNEDNLGRVEWKWDDMLPDTAYQDLRRMCEMGHLYCARGERKMLVTHLPISLLECTKETIILTYLFKGSVMKSFLDIHNICINNLLDTHPEIDFSYDPAQWKQNVRNLVTLADSPSTLQIKRKNMNMTSNWFAKTAEKDELSFLGKAIRSIIQKHGRENILLTTKKSSLMRRTRDNKSNTRCILPRGLNVDDCFLHSGARAVNDYADRDVAIHAYNRYLHVSTKAYLQDYGTPPKDDDYALSEMVQWLWRTAIRNNHPVTFYILSSRMEQLLKQWLYDS